MDDFTMNLTSLGKQMLGDLDKGDFFNQDTDGGMKIKTQTHWNLHPAMVEYFDMCKYTIELMPADTEVNSWMLESPC
jgi:hypothetical protein